MTQTITKFILPWVTVIALFLFGFYLSTHNEKIFLISAQNDASENNLIEDKDYSLRKKLLNDFETAFLKQYTPIIGCEALDNDVKSAKCNHHLEQYKNEFKQQFIKKRGLPKNTFEELKLSFVE